MSTTCPKVSFDVQTRTWVAWHDATDVIGYGPNADTALADYWDNVHELHDRLVDLGQPKVSARLWAKMPLLREALGLEDLVQ